VKFCHLVTKKKKKKKATWNSNKRIFWKNKVPTLPDFDEKNSEIITFSQ